MSLSTNDKMTLACYREVADIREEHQVSLVQHVVSGQFFVKKTVTRYDLSVYHMLKEKSFVGIPRVIDYFEDENELIVIEEYISGETIESMLQSGKKFTTGEVVKIAVNLCSIVEQLHAMHPAIIHRDIKPSNILLFRGQVFLLDYNAAKPYHPEKSRDTVLLGTEGYAAPEQYGFGSSSPKSDIYAIGILMKTMLNGSPDSNRSIPGKLGAIILKCTRIDSSRRYQNIALLKKDLQKDGPVSPEKDYHPGYLPGFRSGTPAHMVPALFAYALITYLCATLTMDSAPGPEIILWRITCWVFLMSFVLFSFDYMSLQRFAPFARSSVPFLQLFGIVLAYILLFIVLVMPTAILSQLLF